MKRVSTAIFLVLQKTLDRRRSAWIVPTFMLLLAFITPATNHAQDGPGGIGSTDGASNLSLWLDAGTITGVNDGANISTWLDQSGNGNHVVIGTAPSYSSSGGGNGRPAVYFDDNSSEYLYVNSNGEIFPANEVSAFVAASYDIASDSWACLIQASSYNSWDDGWGIGEDSNNEDMLFYVEDYNTAGYFSMQTNIDDPAANHIYGLVYNTSNNTGYGYRSESVTTFTGFTGSFSYDAGGNDNLLIGAGTDDAGANYFMTGYIEEIILFDRALNSAERVILNNYLSAKYDIALNANDVYNKDNNAQGDFDYHVAGIGRINAANIHDEAQGTGIVRVSNPTDLGNDEFFIWGFDNGALEASNMSDVPAGVEARFVGQWRVSERSTALAAVDVGSVDISFDLDGMGSIDADDLVLLVDTDNDGLYSDETAITGATIVSGSVYQFAGVSAMTNSDRFTLGTADRAATPLIDTSGEWPDGPGGVGSTDGNSDLSLWLDANAITGVSNGADLSNWPDQSGNGNDATVTSSIAGANTAPTYYSSAGGNSQPTVTFNGLTQDDGMEISGNSEILPTSELSVFWAGNYEDGDNWAGVLFAADDDNWDDGWGFARNNGNDYGWGWVENYNNPGVQFDFTGQYGTNHIWNWNYDATDAQVTGYRSESASTPAAYSGSINYDTGGGGKNDNLIIGRSYDAAEHFQGDISEIIEYDVSLNEAQRIIVANYLSAKYNITLAANNVYRGDNAGQGEHDFDVAGIGQASDGSNHTDAQGNIVRILNPTDLDNNEFLMWGHDNGALTATETADVPTGVDMRLERVWHVSEHSGSGAVDVGSVDMWWDLTDLGITDTIQLRLLIDEDKDGLFSDETPIRGSYQIDGSKFRFLGVDQLTNNVKFTMGFMLPGPGHVNDNLVLWLRADNGVYKGSLAAADGEEIDTWEDLSGTGNNATKAGASEYATYAATKHNYNPAVYFGNGDNGYFDVNLDDIKSTDYNLIAVVERDNSNTVSYFLGTDVAAANQGLHFGYRDPDAATLAQYSDDITVFGLNQFNVPAASVALLRGQMDDNTGQIIYELRDGVANSTSEPLHTTHLTGAGNGRLGRGYDNNGFEGWISEVIAYSSTLTTAELNRIYSYLANKYGFELEASDNIVDSEGNTIWDATASAGYNNDIIAIGRDDNTLYYQKQSRTEDDSLFVFLGSLANQNLLNSSTITNDQSYLIIGHNGEALSAAWNETEMPAIVTARFEREWKITNVNFTDTYTLEFEWEELGAFDINDIRLLVDSDGDFTDATIYGPADGLTFSVGSIIVEGVNTSHIPANSSMFVTVASIGSTPLPIDLISFEAQPIEEGRAVQLDWSTASETDNDFFTIERSADNQQWDPILLLPGAGNSSELLEYRAFDEDPLYGLSYYRLKQTDFDGTYSHSNTLLVTIGEFDDRITVYPNPTQTHITIQAPPEELQVLRVVDVLGKDVTPRVISTNRTEASITIDVSQLPVGIYSILTATESIKMIKSP